MKFSVVASLSFIICILGCVFALKFIEPIDFAARESYGLPLTELKPKCDIKDKSLYAKITADQDKSSSVRSKLVQAVLRKANAKDGEITNNDWKNWTREICGPNKILKEISISAIDKIQKCVDRQDRLNDAEKRKAQKDLFKNFCDKVALVAKFDYQASKVGNP